MRIATFNVNSIRRRAEHVGRFLERHQPDVLMLQETRCSGSDFPSDAWQAQGYRGQAVCQGGGRNGVAVVARVPFEVVSDQLPGEPDDTHARWIEVAVEGLHVGGLYLPNGNSGGDEGYAYKLRWMRRLRALAAERLDDFTPLALIGDFNVCPTDADFAARTVPPTDALVRPETRAEFRALIHLGLTDALRALHPHDAPWTYWDYGPAFEENRGLRIDHLLLSPELAERLSGCGVDTEARAEDQPSDHAPVWCDLA